MNLPFSHSHRRPFLKLQGGFTLIEILVVVAIIALLAAILFPVFGRARENARRTSCQSNLKQIGLGIYQYLSDFDETMMPVAIDDQDNPYRSSNPGAVVNYKWMDAIYPYVKSAQIFDCPSANMPDIYKYRYFRDLPAQNTQYGSYSINKTYRIATDNKTPPVSEYFNANLNYTVRVPQLVDASRTAYISDNCWDAYYDGTRGKLGTSKIGPNSLGEPNVYTYVLVSGQTVGSTYWGDPITRSRPFSASDAAQFPLGLPVDMPYVPEVISGVVQNYSGWSARHLGRFNVLFCDGHVKSMTHDQLLAKNSSGTASMFTIEDD